MTVARMDGLKRLGVGETVAAGSAILLLTFMFFRWYGISVESNLLVYLSLFDDGGNAWHMLDLLPVFLALVIAVTVGGMVSRLSGLKWEPRVSLCGVVCVLGGLAVVAILIRIFLPPDLGETFKELESEGFRFEVSPEIGIFLALMAACGIAYGGYRGMREEGVSVTSFLRSVLLLRGRDQ